MKKWNILLIAVVAVAMLSLIFSGCAPDDEESITVGSKTFPEALCQGYMTKYLLEDRGYDVVDEVGLGEVAVIRPALEAGEVDIYWEYTGTALMSVMEYDGMPPGDPEETYQLVHDWDMDENNIKWLDYAPANNTFVIFISDEVYQEYGFTKLSELTEYINDQN